MRLSSTHIRKINEGKIKVEDLTPNQQRQYKQMQIDKKIVENRIEQQIVCRLKNVGKFDVNEIRNVLEIYATDEEEFWVMYNLLDFRWINKQLSLK